MRNILRFLPVVAIVCTMLFLSNSTASSKSPAWQQGEHPRLLATAAERAAVVAKVNASGTTSNALWQHFVSVNSASVTDARYINFADAGVLYWVTGQASYGQQAHDSVMNYVNSTSVATPSIAYYDYEGFYPYRDMLLDFDFAYDRFSSSERQLIYARIALQGAKCHAANPAWAPGNIATLWGLCEYASGVMLEGENFSVTVTNEITTRQNGTKDYLKFPTDVYNISIRSTVGGAVTYFPDTDYNTCESAYDGSRCIDWSPSGNEPAVGATYYVSYTVTPQTDQWRLGGRVFLENYLNYQWRDGTYTGGFAPYSGASLESVIDMIEIARRDLGIDYSQDPDLKHYIDVALYTQLPDGNPSYQGIRYDTFDDSSSWGEDIIDHPADVGLRSWVRRMVAWGMSRYGNDPEYGAKYTWYWGQVFRNPNGTSKEYNGGSDWREVLYFNDSLVSGYPVTTLPAPDWFPYHFFHGRDLVIARTDHFGTPNINAAYVSLLASNHNHQTEHDQADSGSFTFYSLQEDWAIDPGYQQSTDVGGGATSPDHNTVGIDGSGYSPTGIYGVSGSIPAYGGFSHMDHVALTEGASAMKADLAHAWSLTDTPFVDHQYRYLAMVNGGPSSYLVVGDDVQKDASPHSYQWYFSTGPGNAVAQNGSVTTITGTRTGAQLDIHTIAPTTTSDTIEDWAAGNMFPWNYKRLTITASNTVNPHFLQLLIPTPSGATKPTVTQAVITNGVRATVVWPNGMVDTILWRTGAGTISDATITTDATLTIIRDTSGIMTGLMVMDGRSVTRQGVTLFQALDGSQPVTFSSFDGTASVAGSDVSRVQVRLPQITVGHIADGTQSVNVATSGMDTYLTAGLSFDSAATNGGILLAEHFDSTYVHNLVSPNIEHYAATEQAVKNGALDLSATTRDWVSLSRRDSTPWRRTGLTPNALPPDSFGDGTYSWRFRFTDATAANRDFKFYFLVHDHNATDWDTNQDYLRLDFNPIAGQLTIGQRINGAWTTIDDNDTLTSTTAGVPISINDTSWHTAALTIDGQTVSVTVDGSLVYSGTSSEPMPAPGYIQWRVTGTEHVQIDDLVITANDRAVPVGPTSGVILPQGTSGVASLMYSHGSSPDTQTVKIYSSARPILADTNPDTLTLVGQSSSVQSVPLATVNRLVYYAALVIDTAGNQSQLTPLTIDNTPPAAVKDLQAQ